MRRFWGTTHNLKVFFQKHVGSKSIEKQRNYYSRLDFDSYPGVIPLFPVKGLLGIKLQVETNGTVFHGQSYLPNEKHFHLEMKVSLKSNRINDFKGNVDSFFAWLP